MPLFLKFVSMQMGGDIIGEINFYSHTIDGSLPWADATAKLGQITSNFVRLPTKLTIHDLRGKQNNLDIDINGFEILKYDGDINDEFDDNSKEQQCYYEDIVTILKTRLGASRIIVFNHVIRYRGPSRPADQCDLTHKNPVFYPHVDNNPSSAHLKVEEIIGEEEAKKATQNRFQIINIWRPLGPNPIINTPLTICDYRSLDINNDIHLSEVRGTNNSVSVYAISRNIEDAQKWYYLSGMRSNEMFMFKIFDSNPNVAQFGAHTAFNNEYEPSTNLKQCSIELRCLVLYDQ